MPNEPIKVWVASYASADYKNIGTGAAVYWTEEEAYEDLRQELRNDADGRYTDDSEDDELRERYDDIAKMDHEELIDAYAELYDDVMYAVTIQELTLPAQPDLSTVDKVEEFLGGTDGGH